MSIRATSVTVSTTATLLLTGTDTDGNTRYRDAIVKVPSGGATIYVGAADVTSEEGFPVAGGESLRLSEVPADAMPYAVVESDTQAVSVLQLGV